MVKRHPGLTRKILEQIGPFQEIAIVAGEHHEKLDGSGYPELPEGARSFDRVANRRGRRYLWGAVRRTGRIEKG